MTDSALARSTEILEKVTEFNVFLHANDGDSYLSREVATPLILAAARIQSYVDHLLSVPFQPDR